MHQDESVPEPLREPTANQAMERRQAAEDAAPSALPAKADWGERGRIRAAVKAARLNYPAPIARVLVNELEAWDSFGYRWGRSGTIEPLIELLLAPVSVGSEAA
jgi:hypothetical protein